MNNTYESFNQEGRQQLFYQAKVNPLKIINFAYTFLYMRKTIHQNNTIEDIPNPLSSENCSLRAQNIIKQLTKPQGYKRTILRHIMSEFKKQIIFCCLLVLVDFVLKISNSVLMGVVIRYLTNKEQTAIELSNFSITIGTFFASLFFGIYSKLWVYHYCTQLGAKLRFTITYLVYYKTMKLSSTNLADFGLGTLMNLVSNDLNDLDNGVVWVFQLVMLPVNLCLATWAIWQSFEYYSIVGLIVLIISLKIQDMISKTVKGPLREKNAISDKRVYYCKQMVKNIKTVKMYVWESKLLELIEELRKKEVVLNFNIMLNQGISKILSYFSLMISILAMVLLKTMVETAKLQKDSVYASIGIFGVIKNTNFNGGLNYWTSLSILMVRVEKFIKLQNIKTRSVNKLVYQSKNVQIEFQSKNKTESRSELTEKKQHVSSDITYLFQKSITQQIPLFKGQFNLHVTSKAFIYGLSGSGKTSLVEAFLNQSRYYLIQNFKGTLSYVPQQPVLFNLTIQQNIIFGRAYNQDKFNRVIRVCCLDKDLQKFSDGPLTKVEMGGSSFSGGQKARIGLARALYSESDVYLFDNCLSALDPKVRKSVHKNLFFDFLVEKTVIFSTSSIDQLLEDSFLILMQNKQIKYCGKYNPDLIERPSKEIEKAQQKVFIQTKREQPPAQTPTAAQIQDQGQIKKQTYLYYIRHFGSSYKGAMKILIVITLFVLCELSVLTFYKNLPLLDTDTWVRLKSIGNYLTLYLCLDYLRMYVMVMLASNNSVKCHKEFINKVAYARYEWYFKKQHELINVFANHVGVVDRPLPNIIYDVVKGLLSNAIYIVSLCIVTPAFIPLAFVLTVGFGFVKQRFRYYIRKCKMYELKYRSPMYNKLGEVFAGSTVIRAFNIQQQFSSQFNKIVYESERTFFAFTKINRMFDFVLQLIVFLMIVLGITLTLVFHEAGSERSSNLALSIFTLISMTSQLSFNIRQTLNVELNLISLQKILSYQQTPQQQMFHQPADMSMIQMVDTIKGDINFHNVKMKYPGSNNYCLNNLNLTIKEGQKIALMGRTGAGKSSVFLALYRLFEIQPESTITIGGKDIRHIDLYTLRKNYLSCSAQDPIKLQPLTKDTSPSQLKYDSIVNSNSTPVKLLDEPFANIDAELENKIWAYVDTLKTVLGVVHSGDLERWQRIIVMEDGAVAKDTKFVS